MFAECREQGLLGKSEVLAQEVRHPSLQPKGLHSQDQAVVGFP